MKKTKRQSGNIPMSTTYSFQHSTKHDNVM